MDNLPDKCLVDTNVPKTANLAVDPGNIPNDLANCVLACVEAIDYVVKNGRLVLDDADEIFDEYRKQLSLSGQPGVGDHFMKWVHDNRWKFPDADRVSITRNGDSYDEFPDHENLVDFDISDRKFVAVANRHPSKPPILEATDSKWWGWKDVLDQVGIIVRFICPQYIEAKYREKMGK
jgi:hypothetical protein